MQKERFNIVGSTLSQTGYDIHTRNLAIGLEELGNEVTIEGPRPANIFGCPDILFRILGRLPSQDSVSIFVGIPPFWPLKIADKPKKFIGFCVWEGSNIPLYWKKYIEDKRIDAVFVPSSHTKKAVEAVASPKNIFVIPHGVDHNIFKPMQRPENPNFVFLANKGWAKGIHDRGGLQYLFRAFKEEFAEKDKVELIAKINTAYCPLGWNLNNEMQMLGIQKEGALLKITTDSVPYENMPNFYANGDVFVAPSRAEAFNLTCIEAMACSLPVLTSNFGGQTDYVNEENGWFIGGEFEEIGLNVDLMYEGVKWLTPSIKELREKMRYCYDNQQEVKAKAKKALEKSQEYSWQNTAKKAMEAMKCI